MASAMARGFWVCVLALPLVIFALHLGIGLASSAPSRTLAVQPAPRERCEFPGAERKRLIVSIVDSLRFETATDPEIMPWLSRQRGSALWGRMTPCLSQLSLLCLRTMFEGSEPLLVTGLHNFTGMDVAEPSLVKGLARRGVRVAAVADGAFISLYQSSLFVHARFEDRPEGSLSRDEFARHKTFEWLDDPRIEVLISHTIDTDAVAHRVGVGHPQYVAKYRETDAFLAEVAAKLETTDSLLVLGDHGHDARGFHSTGISAPTAYFARGPAFTPGMRRDLEMADAYGVMGRVSCEGVPSPAGGNAPIARSEVFSSDLLALLLLLLVVVAATRAVANPPWLRRVLAVGALLVLALGLLAPWLLVTLQSHVNAQWTVGFWIVLTGATLGLATLIRRWLTVPYRQAAALTAWGLVFFALFLGPYYYGAGRNLVFAVSWLLLAYAVPFVRERRVRRWLLLAIVPLIPLAFVTLKEWQSRYVLLEFASHTGPARAALTGAGLFAVAAWFSPERRIWSVPALALLVFSLLGFWTGFGVATLLTAELLFISYVAASQCLRELAARADRSNAASFIAPMVQVSYAFMLYFVLLGSLRFANVDFRFALALTPMERGEAAAALVAIPLVAIKYFGPIGLLLALGLRLELRALLLLMCKLAAMGIFLLGMELSGSERLRLFGALQVQELALCALLYAALLSLFALRIGRASRAALVEAAA